MESNFLKDLTYNYDEIFDGKLTRKKEKVSHVDSAQLSSTYAGKSTQSSRCVAQEIDASSTLIMYDTHNMKHVDESQLTEVRDDIIKKLKLCQNYTYKCSNYCVDGFDFCIRHILRDHRCAGQYEQCNFTYVNGKRCPNALLKADRTSGSARFYCTEHNNFLHRQNQLKETAKKQHDVESNEILLNSLSHHLNVEELDVGESMEPFDAQYQDEEIDVGVEDVFASPFIPHEQIQSPKQNKNHQFTMSDELAIKNEFEDDLKMMTLREVLRYFNEWQESDDDNECLIETPIHSELMHAGCYTISESLSICSALYKSIKHFYNEELLKLRRKLSHRYQVYLREMEEEANMVSIHAQLKDTPEERKSYKEYLAYKSYGRRTGNEAVLYYKRRKKLRLCKRETPVYPPSKKCIHEEDSIKCDSLSLPCSTYCMKHIIYDPKQVLFKQCGVTKGDMECKEPVLPVTNSTCLLHLTLTPKREDYNLSKTEERGEFVNLTNTNITDLSSETEEEVNEDIEYLSEVSSTSESEEDETENIRKYGKGKDIRKGKR